MRILAKSMAVLSSLAIASPALATNGMRMIGFGPVQNSMGGASVAAPLDTATAISNPAGLSALNRRADLSGTYFNPTVKMQVNGLGPGVAATGGQITSDRAASYIPTLGLSWSGLSENVSLGFGASGTSGMGVDYKAELFSSKALTSYSNMRVGPAAAYRVTDGLSVGLALNLMWAQMEWNAGGMYKRDTQNSYGYGATLGVQYTPVEIVTLGLAYETPSTFQNFEWNIPSHQVSDGAGGFVTVPGGREKLEFNQPQVATLGAAVRPVKPLLVAADVEWINWSATNGKNQPQYRSDPNLTGAPNFNLNWDDQVVLKIGAQLEATKELKLRAGYNYGKSPLDKSRAFANLVFPAIAEHHFTLGAGYELGSFSVNLAAVYVPEAKLTGSDPSMGIGSYTTKMSQLAFDFGVAYRM